MHNQTPISAGGRTSELTLVEPSLEDSAPKVLLLRLPPEQQLTANCYFIGHARKADVVWSREDFRAICTRLLNGNDQNNFLMAYRDKSGSPKYAKAFRAHADKRIDWAYDSIRGSAKQKTGLGFYPSNAEGKSCWGALDFDAHDGDRDRSRDLAYKAFAVLSAHPSLWIILGTSGDSGGWHLFLFSRDFYSTADWTRLLREVADKIGAPIRQGILDIFPDETRGIGKGIRAPGTWNPKSDSFDLIAFDNFSPKLNRLPSPKEMNASLGTRSTPYVETPSLPSSEKDAPFRGENGEWELAFAITSPRTRHTQLTTLVGHTFYQASRQIARKNAELQHAEARPAPYTPLAEHLAEFDALWTGMERIWVATLAPLEHEKFETLNTENERDAFRIIRNWSRADGPDFKLVAKSLARRLSLSLQGACNIRNKFCLSGILEKTADYVPHKLACRFRWLL